MPSREVKDLQGEFRKLAENWLTLCKEAGLDILLTCTLRSWDEQDALYAKGRTVMGEGATPVKRPMGRIVTNAKGGQSAHQYGLALDFVIMDKGKPDWSGTSDAWNQAIDLAQKHGMQSLRPMESAHLQHPNWKQLAGLK